MKKAIALVGTFVLSLALFSNGEAQQNAMRPTPIVEIYGSTPEVVDEGVTGWLVDALDGAARGLTRVAAIDRAGWPFVEP